MADHGLFRDHAPADCPRHYQQVVTNMTDFYSKDPQTFADQLVESLYKRLDDVRRAVAVSVDRDDEFEMGISCRLANEEFWMETLLANVEKSR